MTAYSYFSTLVSANALLSVIGVMLTYNVFIDERSSRNVFASRGMTYGIARMIPYARVIIRRDRHRLRLISLICSQWRHHRPYVSAINGKCHSYANAVCVTSNRRYDDRMFDDRWRGGMTNDAGV